MAALAIMPLPIGSLEDALRAALRASAQSPAVHCVVCHATCTRAPADDGAHITACTECGSVLEEAAPPPPYLALVED
jgi:hypothetical protein